MALGDVQSAIELSSLPRVFKVGTATILSGQTTSNLVNLYGGTLVKISTGSSISGATSVTFQSTDVPSGTPKTYMDATPAAFTITLATNADHYSSPQNSAGLSQFVRLVTNTNTSSNLTIDIYVREIS